MPLTPIPPQRNGLTRGEFLQKKPCDEGQERVQSKPKGSIEDDNRFHFMLYINSSPRSAPARPRLGLPRHRSIARSSGERSLAEKWLRPRQNKRARLLYWFPKRCSWQRKRYEARGRRTPWRLGR